MKRRNALQNISLTVGGSIILPAAILQSCQQDDYQTKFFNPEQIELLDEIGDTIIPDTDDSRGAKYISIGKFIDLYINDCYSTQEQELVTIGLKSFENRCVDKYGRKFIKLIQKTKHQCLVDLNTEAVSSHAPHYFLKLKELVLLGYFTSEEGSNRSLQYLPVPGSYTGDININGDQKAWALS